MKTLLVKSFLFISIVSIANASPTKYLCSGDTNYLYVIFNKEIRGAFNEKERGLIISGFSFGKIDYMRKERTGVKLNDILKKQIKKKKR